MSRLIFTPLFLMTMLLNPIGGLHARTVHGDPAIDIALLLDTSNSMDGLISQAKTQLWTIVEEFSQARRGGCSPALRVALFEYGNTNLPATEGYIRQVVPLTDNLDRLSEALFSLTTQGGDEYCGQVIGEAITRLDWTQQNDGFQAIFIAGNEPFDQGQVDFRFACGRAVERGIIVNTIHCGRHNEGVNGHWLEGAKLGKGEALNIDQDREVPHIRCPQDESIMILNEKLNETYLWYGSKKERDYNHQNQRQQDANALEMAPQVAVKRAIAKSGKMYSNATRDLVDSFKDKPEVLADVAENELPEEMKAMSPEERQAHLKAMAEKRESLQKEIQELSVEREIYRMAELEKLADQGEEATLGAAIVQAIQTQLADAGFDRP